jgi:hypothetical protein
VRQVGFVFIAIGDIFTVTLTLPVINPPVSVESSTKPVALAEGAKVKPGNAVAQAIANASALRLR